MEIILSRILTPVLLDIYTIPMVGIVFHIYRNILAFKFSIVKCQVNVGEIVEKQIFLTNNDFNTMVIEVNDHHQLNPHPGS